MKKLILLLTGMVLGQIFCAQSIPQKINYQAVARDASGELMSNEAISVQVSILSGSSSGTIVYSEVHNVNTTNLGLFYFKIGDGSPITGNLTNVPWASAVHFLDVKINGDDLGATELVSVPYAIQAEDALSLSGVPVAASTPSNGQVMMFNAANGNWEPATLASSLVDADGDGWLQGMDLDDNDNTITFYDGDDDSNNEIQDLQLTGNTLTITNNGSATPIDLSNYAELPVTASLGQVLIWNGSSWVAGTGAGDNWGSDVVNVTGSNISGNGTLGNPLMVAELDGDITNEIQDLQLTGNTLTITNNGSATPIDLSSYAELPVTATLGQVLIWNGSSWVAGTGAGDNWGSDVVNVTGSNISGNGTLGNPLMVMELDGDASNELVSYFGLNSTQDSLTLSDAGDYYALALNDLGNGIYGGSGTVPSSTVISLVDQLAFGSNNFVIDGVSNSIGIGTLTPSNRLEVIGDAAKFDSIIIVNGAQAGYVLTSDAAGSASWKPSTSNDHGLLTGLSDDDHPQYAFLNGRSGGQTLIAGTGSGENLILESTADAIKGDVIINPTGGNVGVGISSPTYKLQVNGSMAIPDENSRIVRASDPVDMICSAYGFVNADGTIAPRGTSNFSVLKVGVGIYNLTYTGPRTFSSSDITFSVTPIDDSGNTPAVANYRVISTNTIQVKIWELPTSTVLAHITTNLDRGFAFELRIR